MNIKTLNLCIASCVLLSAMGCTSKPPEPDDYSIYEDPSMKHVIEMIDPQTKAVLDEQHQMARDFGEKYKRATELDRQGYGSNTGVNPNLGNQMWSGAMQSQRNLEQRKADFNRQLMIDRTQGEAQGYIDSDPTR